jgi:hypothetical protein
LRIFENFKTFCYFNTTLTTNHKLYYKEENEWVLPKSRLWCIFELDCPWCIHAPFCIKWLIAFFFCLCRFTSFWTFTFEFMLIPSWSSHPLLFSWELRNTHWVCIPLWKPIINSFLNLWYNLTNSKVHNTCR